MDTTTRVCEVCGLRAIVLGDKVYGHTEKYHTLEQLYASQQRGHTERVTAEIAERTARRILGAEES